MLGRVYHSKVRCYGVLRADFTVPARWKPNSTPLHIAAARGSTSMVRCMLQSFVRSTPPRIKLLSAANRPAPGSCDVLAPTTIHMQTPA